MDHGTDSYRLQNGEYKMLDIRDLIERFEELECQDGETGLDDDEREEFDKLKDLLEELAGNCGDEQWRGEWYPVTLIADDEFTDYARELLEDCGDIPRDLPHYIEIDWDATARNIRIDYSSIDYDGVSYWYR